MAKRCFRCKSISPMVDGIPSKFCSRCFGGRQFELESLYQKYLIYKEKFGEPIIFTPQTSSLVIDT